MDIALSCSLGSKECNYQGRQTDFQGIRLTKTARRTILV